jgi:oligopeptide/dipeptide ABC transporter, ATP-binding protein, C-terminal domain
MSATTLVVNELYTHYQTRLRENIYAVSGVNLRLEEKRVLGIAGESGCGKSTLALSLMGYYFPPLHYKSGSIEIDGTNIMSVNYETLRTRFLGEEIAYIPQAAMNALNPTRKILDFMIDVVRVHRPGSTDQEIHRMVEERFDALHLPTRVLSAYPCELSGGMKQRTVIAISTLLNPKVLIADEPTSALDVTSQKAVIKMLRELISEGFVKSMIFITHELPLLYNVTDDIMVMYAGQIVESGTAKQAVFEPIHPYSKGLMGSIIVPEQGLRGIKLTAIPGVPPNLKAPPSGCRFAERCRYEVPECRQRPVELRDAGSGRSYRCILAEGEMKETKENVCQ